jgi:hypothetical protein
MNIVFSKKDHKYSKGDKVFTSVSKLISKYKNEFNKDHWSTYKALESLIPNFKEFKKGWDISKDNFILYAVQHVDPGLLNTKIQEILTNWEDETNKSIDKGNMYHLSKEAESYKRGFEINPFTKKEVPVRGSYNDKESKGSIITNLWELEDGYYPELIIWNENASLAGQADKIFIETENGIRYVEVDDFKTNKKINKTGFKGQRMKPPLSHLDDANYTHYNLQLSAYAWMMEQFGYTVRNIGFHHYNQLYKLPYLKTEIENIL